MGKTRNGILITIIMAFVCAVTLLCGTAAVRAEGSRDIVLSSQENADDVAKAENPYASPVPKSNQARWSFMAYKNPGLFMGVSQQQKVKFYAYEGEVVFIASNEIERTDDVKMTLPDGQVQNIDLSADKGYISSLKNEAAGPKSPDDKPLTLKKEGNEADKYTAYQYTAPQSGMYVLEFYTDVSTATNSQAGGSSPGNMKLNTDINGAHSQNHVLSWDVTVTQPQRETPESEITGYNEVNGRVWMDAIAMQNSGDVYGYLHVVTRDGYIWKFGLNGMQPNTFSMYANSRGNIGSGTNASAYHSIHFPLSNTTSFASLKNLTDKNGNPDGVYILGPDNEVTDVDSPYHMFVNYPDNTISDSIVKATPQEPGNVKSIKFDGQPSGETSDENITTNNSGYVGAGGYFVVETDAATSYRVIIDMSNMYAKHYHGESGYTSSYDDADKIHNDEICLSTPDDINFIYKSGGKWYAVMAVEQKDGKYNRHPTNLGNTIGGTGSSQALDNYVKYEEITAENYQDLYEGLTTNEQKFLSENGYKSLGKVMLGNTAVNGNQQPNRIKWDGRDHYGRILPMGTYFGNTPRGTVTAEIKAGEVHFPLGDVENMNQGISLWLENAPQWMVFDDEGKQLGLDKQIEARSNVYYNNLDEGLLRDYAIDTFPFAYTRKKKGNSGTESVISGNYGIGNNTWYWNLSKNQSCTKSGEKVMGAAASFNPSTADVEYGFVNVSNPYFPEDNEAGSPADILAAFKSHTIDVVNETLNGKWRATDATFEDMSIDGIASYEFGSGASVDARKLTKNAAVSTSDGACDHGIVDVWTYAAARQANNKVMTEAISLDNYDNQKLLTGFVFLDTSRTDNTGIGVYDKATDDRELPLATIVASYGSRKNIEGSDPNEPVTYKAVTNTYGYYSIPIDMRAFGEGAKTVTLTITYSDPLAGNDVITHRVTTVGKNGQEYGEKPNVCVQTVNLATRNENQKIVYAANVGYISKPTDKALRIHAMWKPEELRDVSMSAAFEIYGVLKNSAEGNVTSDDPEVKAILEILAGDADGSQYNTLTEEQKKKLYDFYKENAAYKKTGISVDEALGAVVSYDDLPQYTLKLDKASNNVAPDQYYDYRVFYTGSASLNSVQLNRGVYEEKYDNWEFTIITQPSNLKETVWYDKNHNGKKDEGEPGIEGAIVHIAKRNALTGDTEGVEADGRYQDSFDKVIENPAYDENLPDSHEYNIDLTVNKTTTVFLTNKDGELIDLAYAYEPGKGTNQTGGKVGKRISEEKETPEYTGLQGLIPGHYRVIIELPEGCPYNSVAYSSNGDKDGDGVIEASAEETTITQYIDIHANATQEAYAGYSYMGGLSIHKSVEPYNTTQEAIDKYIKHQYFVYKLTLGNVTEAELDETGTKIIPVEDTKTNLSTGVEIDGDPNKALVFKKRGAGNEVSAIFTLVAGERITINDLPNGTAYTIMELDDVKTQKDSKVPVDESDPDTYKQDPFLDGLSDADGYTDTVSGVVYDEGVVDLSTKSGLDESNENPRKAKNMPNGFELSPALGNQKSRSSSISDTARTALASFTNKYQPIAVTAFGMSEPDESNVEYLDAYNYNSLGIKARVLLDGREIKESDKFKLSLEPSTWFLQLNGNDGEEHVLQPGLSPDVKNADGSINTEIPVDTKNGVDSAKGEVSVTLDNKYTMTFTQPGVYSYILREMKPYTTDNIDPIPGVKYANERYKLYIDVTDDASIVENKDKDKAGTGHLVVENFFWRRSLKPDEEQHTKIDPWDNDDWYSLPYGQFKDESNVAGNMKHNPTYGDDAGENKGKSMLEFNNVYDLTAPEVAFEGTKTLSGRDLNAGEFEFKIEAAGKKQLNKGTGEFTNDESMPTPHPTAEPASSAPDSSRTKNTVDPANNIKFNPITFTEDNAGEDEANAIIYRYKITEIKPEDAAVPGITYDENSQYVYVRVYKEVVTADDKGTPDDTADDEFYQIVHAAQCDENGEPASGFSFTNSYAPEALKLYLSDVPEGETANSAPMGLSVDKILQSTDDARIFRDGDNFSFILEPSNGAPAAENNTAELKVTGSDSALNSDNGKIDSEKTTISGIKFGEKSFINIAAPSVVKDAEPDAPQYYEYTLKEINPYGTEGNPAIPGIVYDGTVYTIRVYVKDDTENGKLVLDDESSASKSGVDIFKNNECINAVSGEGPAEHKAEFTNKYDPNSSTVEINAAKEFDGDLTKFAGSEKGFKFTLTPVEVIDLDAKTAANYTSGTKSSDETGTFTAQANMPMPGVRKNFEGANMTLYNDASGVIGVAGNGADGREAITVPELTFEAADAGSGKASAKVYHYTLKEENGGNSGVTYDEAVHDYYFSVYMLSGDGDGTEQYVTVELLNDATKSEVEGISGDRTYNFDYTFKNTYASSGTFDFDKLANIAKNLTTSGKISAPSIAAGQFSIKLEPFNSSVSEIPPGFNNMDGYVEFEVKAAENTEAASSLASTFDMSKIKDRFGTDDSVLKANTEGTNVELHFSAPGTYEYLIREVTPAEDGIPTEIGYTYDNYQYKLTLEVTDKYDGALEIKPSVYYRDSLGSEWKESFEAESEDAHKPEGGGPLTLDDIKFINTYTDQYLLTYNSNGALAGDENLPVPENYEENEEVTVYKVESDKSDEGGKLTLTRNSGEMFIGWSEYIEKTDDATGEITYYDTERRNAALTAEDKDFAEKLNIYSLNNGWNSKGILKNIQDSITMPKRSVTLYAVWAADANGNNTPDFAEDGYSVRYYIGDAQVDPDNRTDDYKTNKLLYTCMHHHVVNTEADFLPHNGNTITIGEEDVNLSLNGHENAVFVGWSLSEAYKDNPIVDTYPGMATSDNIEGLLESVNLRTEELMNKYVHDGVLTVYAVWTEDSRGGQVLPPSEPTLGPDETPRPTADPDTTPSPTATPGPETGDGIPDYFQVAYDGNTPEGADGEVVGVPVDHNQYVPGESYIMLAAAPTLDGYTFVGWTDVKEPTAETNRYNPGMPWGPKTAKLDMFYAQWTKNEQSLIIQVFDDANNDGTYGGEETLLGISTDRITLTPKNGGDAIESVEHTDGGGVQFTSDMLKPGDYTLTITIDEDQFNAYDRYTGVNYALGAEQGDIDSKLDGSTLTLTQDINIPYDGYAGAIRYGVTRPYDVVYNMNGAPVEVGLKTDAAPDKDYAYYKGETYYTDSEGRVYDGKVSVLGADSLNETIDSSTGKYIFTDSAGLTHEFLGWSVNSDASAPDTGMSVSELAEGGDYRNNSFKEMPAGDLTLYAVWDRGFNKYPLTFDANGGQYESGGEDALNGTLIDTNKRYVIVSEKDASIPLDENSENRPGYKNAEGKITFPEISREDAVFIGWSATALGVVSDYNTVKDSLLSSIQMLTANTVYAVWAEDTRGKLVDSDGRSCDNPNAYYGDAHSGCVDSDGNPKHGELIKHESDGIADYLQVFYEFNVPSDAEFSGSLNVDPVTYGVDGKYTLNKSVLETFKNTDADAIRQKDYENASADVISDDNAAAYIRSSSLAVEGYAFDGWSVNDPAGANGKAENGMFYAGPTNGLGRAYSFEKSAGRPDVLYAVWRKIVPAAVNVRVYNDVNRDGLCEPEEGLVTGFTIDSVYEVITQSDGGDLEEAFEKGFPLTDKTDDARTGSAFINWFEPGKYKMTLTLDDNVSGNTSFVIRTAKDAHSFVSLDGTVKAKDMELQILEVNNRTITFQYSPTEGFAGELNIAATQGYTLDYDTNGAPVDMVAAPESVSNLYYDNETNVAELPKKADGTELDNDEDGYFYSDANGVKHYFLGWSENKYSDTPEYSADGTSHKVTDKKITIKGETKLYAIWSADKYSVLYYFDDVLDTDETNKVDKAYRDRTYNYDETAALWMPAAREELPAKDKLVFAGWTKNPETAKTALDKVPTAGMLITSVVMPSDNVNVYAVWAVDEDGNKVPDYADNMYIVSYAANGGFPAPEPDSIFFADYTKYYLNGQKAELITIEEGKKRVSRENAVLVGWGKSDNGGNLVSNAAELKTLEAGDEHLTFSDSDVTVYALWAADLNNNDKPDYSETEYTLTYDKNGGEGTVPAAREHLLPGDSVELEKNPGLTMTDAMFIGWSADKAAVQNNGGSAKIFTDAAPQDGVLTSTVTINDKDVTVYAVWAADINHNGTPDYNETPHTLSYDANGGEGTVPEPVTVLPEIKITLDTEKTFTKQGAVFIGWSLNRYTELVTSAEQENSIRIDEYTMGNEDVTVYALYAADNNGDGTPDYGRYTLTYDKNGADEGSAPADNNKYSTGAEVTLKEPDASMKKTDAVFIGWSEKKDEVQNGDGSAKVFDAAPAEGVITKSVKIDADNVTVYAVWAEDGNRNGKPDYDESYSVTYNSNGAPDTVKLPENKAGLDYNSEVTIGDITEGLSDDNDGKGKYYTDANYVKHYFLGWSEDKHADAGDIKYAPNSSVKLNSADITLYAIWSADRYKVLYYINGELDTAKVDQDFRDRSYTFGETAALWMPVSEAEYPQGADATVFAGWSADESMDNTVLNKIPAAGTLVTSVSIPNKDVPVYAVWAEDKNNDNIPDYANDMFLVKYHSNGGFPDPEDHIFFADYTRFYLKDQTADLIGLDEGARRVSRDRAVLVGWGKEAHSELVKSDEELNILIADEANLKFADQNITVYALWAADKNGNDIPDYRENPRTLKYDINGGSGEAPASVGDLLVGDSVELEKAPAITLTDAVFIGWSRQQSVVSAEGKPVIFKSAPGEGVIADSVTVADDDENEITVYAAWAEDINHNGVPDYNETPRTLTYNANGGEGTVPASVTVLPGINIDLEDNVELTKENAVFVGWSLTEYSKLITSLEEENALRIDEYTMGDRNVTVYALYAADLDDNGEADYGRFQVLYDKNGAESGEAPTDNNWYSTGTAVTLKTPDADMTLSGAMFIGWSSNKNAVSTSGGRPVIFTEAPADGIVETEVMIGSANVTVYAVWAADTNNNGVPDYDEFYTVDYDTNGAPDSVKAPTAHTGLTHNGIIQIKDISEGLSTDDEGRYYTDGNGVKVYFEGWSRDARAESADADLAPGKYLSLNSANVTLHAVWRADRFKVLYYIGGALDTEYVSDDFRGRTYAYGETAALWMPLSEAQLPAGAAGTVFAGWTDNKETAEKVLTEVPAAGTLITSVNIPNRDVTVYAVWAEDKDGDKIPDYADSMYLVKYHSNGGFPDPEDHVFFADYTRYYITGAVAELIDVETEGRQRVSLEGAVLVGWGKEAHSAYVTSDEELAGLLADNAYLTFGSENITVYALWAEDKNGNNVPDYDEKTYTLTYDGNGGEGSVPEPVTGLLDGESVALEQNAELSMDKAVFIGWSESEEDVRGADGKPIVFVSAPPKDGVIVDSVEIKASDAAVYAVWAADTNHNGTPDYNEKPHTLYYNANDGEGTVPSAVPGLLPGTDVRLDMAPGLTKSGGVFVGWSLTKYPKLMTSAEEEAALRIKNDTYTMGFDDVTVFALYAADSNGDNIPDYGRYAVTYDKNGAEGSAPVDTNKYSTGSVIRLVQPGADMRLADAVFIGWSENKAAVQDENGGAKIFDAAPESGIITDSVTITTSDVTVYAVWVADKNNNGTPDYNEGYTVSYNANGAPDSVKVPEAQTGLAYNASVKAGDITEGLETDTNGRYYTDESGVKHYFLGWSVSAIGGDIIEVGGEVRINSANVTLYAVWSADRYHVVYDMNGGSGTVPDEYAGRTYAFGENAALYIPLAGERPTKDDVVFVGWSETPVNDALTAPPDYGTIVTSVTLQNGDKTVYAVWSEDKNSDNVPDYADNMYLVKYHINGGTFPKTTDSIFFEDYTRYRLSGQTAELISIDEGRQRVMRDGAVLVGWGKEPHEELVTSAAELAELSADNAYLTFADSDITVYALWAADENGNNVPDYEEKTYTLTYDGNGGEGSVPEPVTGLLDGDVVTLDGAAKPTMPGCEFLGWCDDKTAVTDENGSPMIFTDVPDGVVKDSVTIAGADVTVYAVWKKIPIAEYGVVYNSNGGNDSVPIDEKTYPIGGGVQLMDRGEMTREGAVFLGWSKNAHEQIIMTQDELSERILPAGEIVPLDLGDNSSVMTLFAVWGIDITDGTHTVIEDGTADYYQVFYNSNAGREEVSGMPEADTNSYIDGTDVDIKPGEPVREGYNFLGWSLNDPDGDPIGESAFRKSAGPDVLYAVWEAVVPPDEYGVIYRENHATYGVVPFDDNKYVIDGTDNVPVLGNDGEPELVKEGAAFLGWSKKANNVVVTRFDAENAGILKDHTRFDSPPASGYMNLYAVWAKDENGDGTADYVQAIFDDGVDDGAAAAVTDMPDAITGERGEVYEIPAREPAREGYVFDGWTARGTDGPVYRYGGASSSFTMPDDGIVFVAQWSKYQPQPSPSPTSEPTAEPTDAPATSEPTAEPTDAPATSEPTVEPTDAPATGTPEPGASESPSPSPTKKPGGGSGGSGGGGGGGGFGTASVRVVKEWDDDNNSRGERPSSITIKLMQNGNAVDQCALSAENNWQHTFSNLKTGTEYTVIEEAVNHYAPKYESTSGGYKVINTYDESVVVSPPNGGGGSGGKAPDDLPTLNYDDHYAYIVGYEDGTVQPEGTITRAEVATIFFRMLSESSRDRYMTKGNKFSDVSVGNWFNTAVSTMAAADIVHGYEDGTFRGDDPITRAEFAVIAANFDSSAYDGPDKFSDTGEHWASEYINRAAERGWINGYEDGTFKPDQSITRAEAMALVNRVLERKPSADHMLDDMIVWPDNSDKTKWYYADVQEATNSHYSERGDGGYEVWTSLRPVMDWASLEI